ncbi:MAG: DUF1624 domain-containing protein [Oscillospiraceae bacterium]|jgi:uncharacterized membrane protein|nr:DUF1624 domain-containing protein [Oscillospiraceae bacterium]
MSEQKNRIQIIDALRGLALVLMVFHHLFFDLVEFLNAPAWLFTNPVFDFLHYVFAGLFILLSGVSSRFSHSNIKRGLKTLACAALVTAVSYAVDMPIWFGILHLLAFCMIFYGLLEKALEKLPFWVYILLWAGSILLLRSGILPSLNIFSADWFPPLPWMFVFLFGTWVGKLIAARKFPQWFYDFNVPLLPSVGRKSLWIYLLHQPILYGITMLILKLK